MTIYHVRPRDMHAPGEHCNSYDCTAVVMKHEYDAIAARLAAVEKDNDRLRQEVNVFRESLGQQPLDDARPWEMATDSAAEHEQRSISPPAST